MMASQCLERHGTRSQSEEIADFEKLSFVHVTGADLQFRGILLPSLSWKSLSTRKAQGADLEGHEVSRRVSAAVEWGLSVMHVPRFGAEDCAARRFSPCRGETNVQERRTTFSLEIITKISTGMRAATIPFEVRVSPLCVH